MLNENLRNLRKAKGMSQEDLAVKLNVVRQTVSKWEKGLSVPDSEMIIKIAEELDTTVGVLLGENVEEKQSDSIKELSAKLESINIRLAKLTDGKRRARLRRYAVLVIIAGIILVFGISHIASEKHINDTIGIIGGADGPTSIFITGVQPPYELILLIAAVILVVALIGIYVNRLK